MGHRQNVRWGVLTAGCRVRRGHTAQQAMERRGSTVTHTPVNVLNPHGCLPTDLDFVVLVKIVVVGQYLASVYQSTNVCQVSLKPQSLF